MLYIIPMRVAPAIDHFSLLGPSFECLWCRRPCKWWGLVSVKETPTFSSLQMWIPHATLSSFWNSSNIRPYKLNNSCQNLALSFLLECECWTVNQFNLFITLTDLHLVVRKHIQLEEQGLCYSFLIPIFWKQEWFLFAYKPFHIGEKRR